MTTINPQVINYMRATLVTLRRSPNRFIRALIESLEDPGADGRRAAAQAKRDRKAARNKARL